MALRGLARDDAIEDHAVQPRYSGSLNLRSNPESLVPFLLYFPASTAFHYWDPSLGLSVLWAQSLASVRQPSLSTGRHDEALFFLYRLFCQC